MIIYEKKKILGNIMTIKKNKKHIINMIESMQPHCLNIKK